MQITDRELRKLRRFFSQFSDSGAITDVRGYSREDREFHNYITTLGSKEFLKSVLDTFNVISFSYQFSSSEGLVRDPGETIGEHRAIIQAISDRDPQAAEQLMRAHFQKSIEAIRYRQG